MKITTTSLSHFGLVSGMFDELGIADLIDTSIPKSRNHLLSHSTESNNEVGVFPV
jgi:transposase